MDDAWVTGARGFIGRHVALELSRRGLRVHGIGHGSWFEGERQPWGVSNWVNSEVTAAGLDVLAAQVGRPAIILHLAGGSSVGASLAAPREDFARTVAASAELAEWVRTRSPATRIVAASSAAVYGDAWQHPIPSHAAVRPCSPYGAHKAAMETILAGHARSFGLRVAVVRLFSVYGPGLEKQLLWDMCTRLAAGQMSITLGGTGEETRDFVFVSDAAVMLASAAELAAVECPVFNGGTGRGITVRMLAQTLLEFWPPARELRFNGSVRSGDPRHMIADVSGSMAILPPNFVAFQTGVARAVATAKARLGAG